MSQFRLDFAARWVMRKGFIFQSFLDFEILGKGMGTVQVVRAGVPENGRGNTLLHLGKLKELPRGSTSKPETLRLGRKT